MHIEWLAHPYNPALNGTKEHVSRSVAENAVHFKQAEILPRPNYGTKEWVEERQAAERRVSPHDLVRQLLVDVHRIRVERLGGVAGRGRIDIAGRMHLVGERGGRSR